MTGIITLNIAGTDTGPFNLYSNINGYISAFAVNITKAQLLAGYVTDAIPNGTTIIRIMSIGDCTNYIDVPLPNCLLIGTGVITIPPPTTTTTTTTLPLTTTTSTSISTSTTTTTVIPTTTTTTSSSTSTTTSTTTATPTTTTTTTVTPTTTTTTTVTPTTTTTTTPVVLDCTLAGTAVETSTTITNVTEINIWFDSSGSMDTTLTPLQTMQNTLLKNCIGPIYGYNPGIPGSDALYNTRVKVISIGNEQFVSWLATQRNYRRNVDTSVNQVLNLTFADESNTYEAVTGTFNNTVRTPQYNTDIALLRSNFTATPYIKGIAFQVNTGPNSYPAFRGLTQATFVDTGVYVPPYNISDLSNFTYELDIIAGSTASYYLSKVVSGLNTLGFTVSCTP